MFLPDGGVRAKELCALNVADMDIRTGTVPVRDGKGQKDRVTKIGAKTRKQDISVLRAYLDILEEDVNRARNQSGPVDNIL